MFSIMYIFLHIFERHVIQMQVYLLRVAMHNFPLETHPSPPGLDNRPVAQVEASNSSASQNPDGDSAQAWRTNREQQRRAGVVCVCACPIETQ